MGGVYPSMHLSRGCGQGVWTEGGVDKGDVWTRGMYTTPPQNGHSSGQDASYLNAYTCYLPQMTSVCPRGRGGLHPACTPGCTPFHWMHPQSTGGRYASYWNVSLLCGKFILFVSQPSVRLTRKPADGFMQSCPRHAGEVVYSSLVRFHILMLSAIVPTSSRRPRRDLVRVQVPCSFHLKSRQLC